MSLTVAQHTRLDPECRRKCTDELSWNPAKRMYCREHSMCFQQRQALVVEDLDTSPLVAALTREASTRHVQAWLESHGSEELLISDWVVTEFSSALSIKMRTELPRA